MKPNITTESKCPGCGRGLTYERARRRGGDPPRPGDLSVCIYCAEALVFNDDMSVRQATVGDLLALSEAEREELGRVQVLTRERRHENGLGPCK